MRNGNLLKSQVKPIHSNQEVGVVYYKKTLGRDCLLQNKLLYIHIPYAYVSYKLLVTSTGEATSHSDLKGY